MITRREVQVLQLVAAGLTNAQIAGRLGISPNTVDRYLVAANRKLSVHSRREAVARATEHGLLDPMLN